MKLYFRLLSIFIAVAFTAIIPVVIFAQTTDLGTQCATISDSNTGCQNMSSADCKALLQQCANYYDQQSAQLTADLTKTSAQKDTLQSAIAKLKKKNFCKILKKELVEFMEIFARKKY